MCEQTLLWLLIEVVTLLQGPRMKMQVCVTAQSSQYTARALVFKKKHSLEIGRSKVKIKVFIENCTHVAYVL